MIMLEEKKQMLPKKNYFCNLVKKPVMIKNFSE